MWTDGSQLMSQSLPSSSFIHQQFASSASSSPRSSRDATSEKASPAGKSATSRPSASYSYDGGFFVGAHSGQAEYFVIHPDWVSEAVTIKKLSIGSKTNGPPVSKSASFRNWGGRRCMSAPPAKRRNPITWGQSEPIDIQEKRYWFSKFISFFLTNINLETVVMKIRVILPFPFLTLVLFWSWYLQLITTKRSQNQNTFLVCFFFYYFLKLRKLSLHIYIRVNNLGLTCYNYTKGKQRLLCVCKV